VQRYQPILERLAAASLWCLQATLRQIGDRVWLDVGCDGVQDKDDTSFRNPASRCTVNLETCAGELVATTTTDATGFYLFDNVEDTIEYRVCFVLPDGYSFAPKDQGGSEGLDSDANADGCTDCFSVGDCKPVRYRDAGTDESRKVVRLP
jgi:hypothetical protein